MPDFSARLLGEWILLAASVGVVAGIAILVVVIAYTQLVEPERSDPPADAASAVGIARLAVNPGEITARRQSAPDESGAAAPDHQRAGPDDSVRASREGDAILGSSALPGGRLLDRGIPAAG